LRLFEFGFLRFYLLSSFKFLLAERFTGLKLIAYYFDRKKLPAFPAAVWPLVD